MYRPYILILPVKPIGLYHTWLLDRLSKGKITFIKGCCNTEYNCNKLGSTLRSRESHSPPCLFSVPPWEG